MRIVGPGHPELRWVIIDSEATTNIDYSAARIVRDFTAIWPIVESFSSSHVSIRRCRWIWTGTTSPNRSDRVMSSPASMRNVLDQLLAANK